MSESRRPCLHVAPQEDLPFENKELFTKKSFKTHNSNGPPTRHQLTTADNCPLCFAYGFRRGALEWRDPNAKPTPAEHVNCGQFGRGQEEGRYYATLPLTHPRNPGPASGSIVFPILKGENGEQYHAIICSFLSDCKPAAIKLQAYKREGEDGPSSQPQVDFLRYYLPSGIFDRTSQATNKKSATQYIADVFQQLDTPDKQAECYEEIREFLDDGGFPPQPEGNHYICPSYVAKYWLNRYLVMTGQGKLPKSGPTAPDTKIAIIMIRTAQQSKDPRMMTNDHLKKCINAIRAANKVAADKKGGKPITHVLLYGDRTKAEMENFKASFQEEENVPELLYLTSPFGEDGDHQVEQFWANFRCAGNSFFSEVPESVPLEAKILAIFVALKKRYGNKICTIGFRSGTLDGAGFVGIPIFFLDNVSSAGKGNWDALKDMKYIWDGDSKGAKDGERMAYAGQMMNTFVRVNVKDEYKNDPTFGRVIKDSDDEWKHLGAALYTYMFHEDEGNGGDKLLWLKRVSLMKGQGKGILEARFNAFVQGSKDMKFQGRELVQTVPIEGTGLVKVQTADWASTHEKSWPLLDFNRKGEGFLVEATSRAFNTPTLDLMSFISYFFFLFVFVFFCVLVFS